MELQSDPGHSAYFLFKVREPSSVHKFHRRQLTLRSVLPGIAFSLDLIETTNEYGVAEVLLSSFMAAFIFSVFGAQPLCIAGVTGAFMSIVPPYHQLMHLRAHHCSQQDDLQHSSAPE